MTKKKEIGLGTARIQRIIGETQGFTRGFDKGRVASLDFLIRKIKKRKMKNITLKEIESIRSIENRLAKRRASKLG